MSQAVSEDAPGVGRREWPVGCIDSYATEGTCVVEVSGDVVEVIGPEAEFCFALDLEQVPGFQAALASALAGAQDCRTRRAGR
ncbi:hypothetical protein KCV87_20970 [Actinosynnema pretiosum subsp. pretiosum]|uniref:Uncharacterized protein n=1 Tax=Actinosynnema pretiosum subsp. pretiosum TaxID=103721 RepID=A0AA45L281_9PSEU|nr:hypothetical protein [Actinosynnema mirum]AXX34301.1 hypothetical protein APASM_6936 [Actinosynnema pretiosum subsp. pretiosum]QUF01992.1 hypothetical protein KCV87_20970 [Actinosynnema pretiosum subsp. pretiosum]